MRMLHRLVEHFDDLRNNQRGDLKILSTNDDEILTPPLTIEESICAMYHKSLESEVI